MPSPAMAIGPPASRSRMKLPTAKWRSSGRYGPTKANSRAIRTLEPRLARVHRAEQLGGPLALGVHLAGIERIGRAGEVLGHALEVGRLRCRRPRPS